MKYIPHVAGGLLGALFVMAGMVMLLNLAPDMPPPPEGTPQALFMGAFATTGYLTFVKVLEVIGGVLVAIPLTRNLGLVVLGPIILNILAYHMFIMKGEGIFSPMLLFIVALALYLLWVGRKVFAGLLGTGRAA